MQERLHKAWNYVAETTVKHLDDYEDPEAGLIEAGNSTEQELLEVTMIEPEDARIMAEGYSKAISQQALTAMMKGEEIEAVLAGAFMQGLIIGAVAQADD